ncbi:hypothetical protein N5J23_01050, partial [Comamonas aquatica]|nr:hypothetical protein [Comamonas aquatica]MDH1616702.1 hypothetical protein [Comamonas aquatica]MDH2004148.1 hypothetical protein [Comamonas aquatica]
MLLGLAAFFCLVLLVCVFVVGLLVEAAYRAAATDFLLLRQKKVSKEKATLLSASLWALLRKSQAGN